MFDAKKITEECVAWIQDFFEKNGKGCNAIIGISGGKDSSVTAALCAKALGPERVIGVLMPCGEQKDMDCSLQLVNHLGIKYYIVNIKEAVDGVLKELGGLFEISAQTRVNLPPRIRMATLYAVGQSHNGRVANTCNLSEDWVGYSTRYGDAAGDFGPLSKLTVQEVKAVGRVLGLPENLIEKVPADGLQAKTDEDNLGFKYATLDKYIREGICENPDTKALIDHKRATSKFKLEMFPTYDPGIEVKIKE